MELTLTKVNFQEEVLKAKKPVLVDFWATWCGPCKMQAPVLEELAAERSDVIIGKVNVDDEPELANAFQVNSIPTLILFNNGEAVRAAIGYRTKDQLIEMITL
ncbi:MAG: thioredoxin [Firmicutes bacterium]|nr:thioredoxin [Bacillota bacterium]